MRNPGQEPSDQGFVVERVKGIEPSLSAGELAWTLRSADVNGLRCLWMRYRFPLFPVVPRCYGHVGARRLGLPRAPRR